MRMRAFLMWVVLTAIGTVTMLALQLTVRGWNPVIVGPFSQGAGLLVAWTLAWPLWFRHQPKHQGFGIHVAGMIVILVLIAAIRIELGLG